MKQSKKSDLAIEELIDVVDVDDDVGFLLLTGDSSVYGLEDYTTLVLIGHCLGEVVSEIYLDKKGRRTCTPPPGYHDEPPAKTREIERAVEAAQASGASFVLCYHVSGDAQWRFVWSHDHDCDSATQEVINYLRCGIMFPEFQRVSP